MTTTAFFIFGRFNPPTRGHEILVDAIAHQQYSFLFPSRTENNSSNPISIYDKVRLLTDLFPTVKVIDDPEIRSPHDVILWMAAKGFDRVVFVVGSDRVDEFKVRWIPYAKEYIKSCYVVSIGQDRHSASSGIAGMSATNVRNAANNNDLDGVMHASGWSSDISKRIITIICKNKTKHWKIDGK